jgi:hypothetical protein
LILPENRAILRRPMRRSLALALLALAAGCSSPCQDLATRICECEPSGAERRICQRSIEDQIGSGDQRPGDSEQDFCEEKLKSCPDPSDSPGVCELLRTPEGKQACGLAF